MGGSGAVLVVEAFDVIVDVVLHHFLHLDTRLQTRGHGHNKFQSELWKGWLGGYLAFGGGFAADCDLLQGVTVAEGLQWRQQSWDTFSAGGDGAQGLGTSLFSSSRCLELDSGAGRKGALQRQIHGAGEDSWRNKRGEKAKLRPLLIHASNLTGSAAHHRTEPRPNTARTCKLHMCC